MTGDTAIRRLTAAAVLLVAAIAAVVSYVHIEDLAVTHGQTLLAAVLLPLSIDGTVAAASLAMLRAARAGLPTPRLGRFMLGLAVVATLAANVAYGIPFGVPGALLSGWPAVAFIGCTELSVGMVRKLGRAAPKVHPMPVPGMHPRTRPARTPPRTPGTPASVEDAEREFMTELATGTVPSIRQVRTRMHVGQDRARALKAHLEHVARERVDA